MKLLVLLCVVVASVTARPGHLITPYHGTPLVHTIGSPAVLHAAPVQLAAAPVQITASAPTVLHSAPVQLAAAPAVLHSAPVQIAAPAPAIQLATTSQYHAQDELGQYSYGYAGGPSAKHETKTWDGITRGGYSYIDANGILQTVHYISDPVNGFRVAATNLPVAPAADSSVGPLPVVDTPEVVAAKSAHLAALSEAKLRAAEVAVATPAVAEVVATPAEVESVAAEVEAAPAEIAAVAPAQIVATAPITAEVVSTPVIASVAATPAVSTPFAYAHPAIHTFAAAPVLATSSQYHAQDELGQYSYGYAGGPSAKHESKTWDGVTRGGYSYIDANGILQTVHYVSDPINGFRVAATNLPVAPAADVPVPQQVLDAPDVAIAKAAHFAAHVEAKARL